MQRSAGMLLPRITGFTCTSLNDGEGEGCWKRKEVRREERRFAGTVGQKKILVGVKTSLVLFQNYHDGCLSLKTRNQNIPRLAKLSRRDVYVEFHEIDHLRCVIGSWDGQTNAARYWGSEAGS
jgi:hypothetical protein